MEKEINFAPHVLTADELLKINVSRVVLQFQRYNKIFSNLVVAEYSGLIEVFPLRLSVPIDVFSVVPSTSNR